MHLPTPEKPEGFYTEFKSFLMESEAVKKNTDAAKNGDTTPVQSTTNQTTATETAQLAVP